MNRPQHGTAAAERARWLAQLAQAVEQAQRLAWSLSVSQQSTAEVEELSRSLEAVRIEIEALRRGRPGIPQREIDPFWSGLLPWSGRPDG